MIGIYKTIISLIIWPIWFMFFVPSLFLLYALVFIIPPKYFYLIVRPVCWIYCLLAGQILLIENKPPPLQGQPYLYLFNHVSMFDQFMVGAFISHYITAIGAEEIFEYPVWGRLIRRYGAIPIKRKRLKSAIKSLDLVEMAINNGTSFIIAPEGTRSTTGDMGVFKKGPFHLAKNTGITIVPVALLGAYRAKKKNDWRLMPGIITTKFGDPIKQDEYKSLSVEGIRDLTRARIEGLMEGDN